MSKRKWKDMNPEQKLKHRAHCRKWAAKKSVLTQQRLSTEKLERVERKARELTDKVNLKQEKAQLKAAAVRLWEEEKLQRAERVSTTYHTFLASTQPEKNVMWQANKKDFRRSVAVLPSLFPDYGYHSKRQSGVQSRKRDSFREYQSQLPTRKLRNRLSHRLKETQGDQPQGTMRRLLGCSFKELKTHIEGKFLVGMTWDNWGIRGWHLDHRFPLSLLTRDGNHNLIGYIWHHTNLQPMWAGEHLSKSDNCPELDGLSGTQIVAYLQSKGIGPKEHTFSLELSSNDEVNQHRGKVENA